MVEMKRYDVWYTVPGLLPRCETVRASSPERAAESAMAGVRCGTVRRVEIARKIIAPGAVERKEEDECRS